MKRVSFIVFWILTAATLCSAQTTLYFPHVANGVLSGDVWKTTIFLTNPASSGTASGTITFFKDNSTGSAAGSAFTSISFTDQDGAPAGSGGVITFSITGGQSRKYVSAGTGDYAGGFATVATSAGTVSGTAIFTHLDPSGTGLIAEAGVPSASAVTRQAIFVDTVGGFNVGVAYANPGTAAANVTLTLLNSSAATVATTTEALGPGNHGAAFTFQKFPTAGQLAGTMQITSNVGLAAIALRFDSAFRLFTTLPPVTLASVINPLTSIARLLAALHWRLA